MKINIEAMPSLPPLHRADSKAAVTIEVALPNDRKLMDAVQQAVKVLQEAGAE